MKLRFTPFIFTFALAALVQTSAALSDTTPPPNHEARIKKLESHVATLEKQVSVLQSRLSKAEADISNNASAISAVTTKLDIDEKAISKMMARKLVYVNRHAFRTPGKQEAICSDDEVL